jgi:hypothetical protein
MSTRFYAHFRDEDPHASPVRDAVSAEDAAIGFLECHHPPMLDESVAIIVLDHETGGRHCFNVDLGSGEAEPCD